MMNILLDTHILLWTLTGSEQLSNKAIEIISDKNNIIYYSIASVWETEIKNFIGKMPICGEELADYCKQAGFKLLGIKEEHVFQLKTLYRREDVPKHNDPSDRIMLAQSKYEKYKFLTHDRLIMQYNESCVIEV